MNINRNDSIKRILCIIGSMNMGGAETQIMKIYRALDKNKYQMDFFVSLQTSGYYDDEILSLGGHIFRSNTKAKGAFKYYKELYNHIRTHSYVSVIRSAANAVSFLDLLPAKILGIKSRALRSSTTSQHGNRYYLYLHVIFRFFMSYDSIIRLAPSTEAATYMFGHRCEKKHQYHILKNSIDTRCFQFDNSIRCLTRKNLNIDDFFVIGHIGRFEYPKNHHFIIECFAEIVKKNKNCFLLLIGEGTLKEQIIELTNKKGIASNIAILPNSSNIASYLMAMDCLLFPSIYEGMPNVVIEAQATGLPCYISDSISLEVKITNLVQCHPLSSGPKAWADLIKIEPNEARTHYADIVRDAGYDSVNTAKELIGFLGID